jgi:hypothetical protein
VGLEQSHPTFDGTRGDEKRRTMNGTLGNQGSGIEIHDTTAELIEKFFQ